MPYFNTDIPELKGFDTEVCLANLELLGTRQDRIDESVLAILSEMADAILRDAAGDPDTINSILLSLQSSSEGEGGDNSPSCPHLLDTVDREAFLHISLRTELYARLLLYAMLEKRAPSVPSRSTPPPRPSATVRGRIAYMPSVFADKAYLRLSSYVDNPRAATTDSFVDACEEVRSGLCEYCILPLENTHSGKLTAFTRLILNFDLQISLVCDLENAATEGQITRFALLRRTTDGKPFPSLHPIVTRAPLYMELIHRGPSHSLTELLSAAEFCGMSLCRLDTLPLPPTMREGETFSKATDCLFRVFEETDLNTFHRFLTLEASEDTLIGLYNAI